MIYLVRVFSWINSPPHHLRHHYCHCHNHLPTHTDLVPKINMIEMLFIYEYVFRYLCIREREIYREGESVREIYI